MDLSRLNAVPSSHLGGTSFESQALRGRALHAREWGFSNLTLNVVGEDCKTRLCNQRSPDRLSLDGFEEGFHYGENSVDISFSALNRTKSNGVTAPQIVTDVGAPSLNGPHIDDLTFSGGTAVFTSSQIPTTLSGFYGNDANEIGGVFIVDNTTNASSLLLQGIFIEE